MRTVLALLVVCCLCRQFAHAATIIWTNSNGGNWSSVANWSPNQLPGDGDNAMITNNGTYTVTLDASATIASLTLGGASGHQTLTNGGSTLTLTNASTVNTNGILGINGGTLGGSGLLTVQGGFKWTSGYILGAVTIASGGLLSVSGSSDKYLGGSTLNNAGSVTWTAGNLVGRNQSGDVNVISNQLGAVFDLQTDAALTCCYSCCGPASFTVYNAGTFRKSAGTGTNNIDWVFNNSGTVDVQSGGLSFNAGGTGTGTFNAGSSAVMILTGAYGNYTGNSGTAFTGAGLKRLTGGTVTLNGTIPANNLELAGATLAGTNTWSGGTSSWTSGYILGAVTIASGGLLSVSGSSDKYFGGSTLNNAGSVTWTAGNLVGRNQSGDVNVISNQLGAVFDLQTDAALTCCYGCCGPASFTVYNAGTFRKSAGTGTNNIDWVFNNSGTVDVQSGGLSFNAGGTGTGTFNAGSSAVMILTGAYGNYTGNSGTAFTGAGLKRLTGGTVTLNGTIPANNLELAGATLAGTNTWSGGTNSWTSGYILGAATIASGGLLSVSSSSDKYLGGSTLNNAGSVTWTAGNLVGRNQSGDVNVISNQLGAVFDLQTDAALTCCYSCCGPASFTVYNAGTFRKSAGTGTNNIDWVFNNSGTVDIRVGTLSFNGPSFVNAAGAVVQGYGTLNVANTTFVNRGIINPGSSVGILTLIGNLPQTSSCVINIELGGTAATNYDRLLVSGTAQLDGTLNVQLVNGFRPVGGDVFTILSSSALSGTFAANNANLAGLGIIYTPTNVYLISSNDVPSVTISGPSTQVVCVPFQLQVTATDLDDAVTNVDLLVGSTVLASFPNPPSQFQLVVSYDFPGSNNFTARAHDARGAMGTATQATFFYTPPQHVLIPAGIQSNGAFKFCMLGETGRTYSALANTNLKTTNWVSLGTMEATNGIWRYSDLAATNFPMRYYRALKQ